MTPSGTLAPVAASYVNGALSLPAGWLAANGQAVSRAAYPALFAALQMQWQASFASGIPFNSALLNAGSLLRVGQPVESPALPTGTTVATITGDTVTFSKTPTATGAFTVAVFPLGNGDGSTTFNVQDMRGRVYMGADPGAVHLPAGVTSGQVGGEANHTLTVAELPPHTHHYNGTAWSFWVHTDTGMGAGGSNPYPMTVDQAQQGEVLDNTGSGVGHNNLPPYLAGVWAVKT
jgi:microcystin-dependent protein